VLYHGRTRFVMPELYSRQEGVRSVIKALRRGLPFYYLPDMDFGGRDSIFVPFFGVPTATITGLSRIARLAGAAVVPAVTRQLPGAGGYVLTFFPAWRDFPSDDLEADARRMNAFIEERVLEMPEQYYWLHKRFKTRPPGYRLPVLDPLHAHQPPHPLLGGPPQDAVLEETSPECLKMEACDVPALGLTPLRKAKPEVSEHYLTALTPQ